MRYREHLKAAPCTLPGHRCFPQQLLDVLHLVALNQLLRLLETHIRKNVNRMCTTIYVCTEQEVTLKNMANVCCLHVLLGNVVPPRLHPGQMYIKVL